MPRLFTALLLPDPVRAELAALAQPVPGARWLPADTFHLTLRFLGEVSDARADEFAAALARVRVEPFILAAGGLGVFPTRGPAKVIWAGFGTAHPRLFQLRKQVDEALLAVDPGVEVNTFHPHVTVARLERDYETKPLTRYLEAHRGFESGPWRVTEFHLMASEAGPGAAPRYRRVRRFALGE